MSAAVNFFPVSSPSCPPSPTNLEEAVAFYIGLGLAVTPVRPNTKRGMDGWSKPGRRWTRADFRLGDNVGVLNGVEPRPGWFFYDIDIDANTDAARTVVERFLPKTGWWYGRPSKPRSHANFLVAAKLRVQQYHGLDGAMALELRGWTKKDTYTLSVAPGSTWVAKDEPTRREPIRFAEPRGDIGRVDAADSAAFERAVQLAAAGIIITQVWPSHTGARHSLRLAFANILLAHHLSEVEAIRLLEAVMVATGSDVDDVASAVRDTATTRAHSEATRGAATVIEVFGEERGRAALKALEKVLPLVAVDEERDVVVRGGDLSSIVDRVEGALLAEPIYQRGGGLVRPIRLDQPVGNDPRTDVRRPVGATVLADVRETWLTEQMGRALRWFRASRDGRVAIDPPGAYARTLLGRGEWRFPVLRGVVNAPTLAADGRIIETPGYDTESGLLLDFARDTFAPVPDKPTEDEARAALALVAHPVRAFPFVNGASRSVALSAILTALVRGSLRTSPLHGFDAPTAGTGKSLLAELPGLIATGVKPPALSQGKSEEEDEKRLSTVLFAGDPTIHLDNCERPLSGDFLCSMLTQETVQARILGQSERRILPSTALVLASGNNLAFAGDTSRRAVVCRLDAGVEKPEERAFDFDCHGEVRASRAVLVVAGLTVLRAYHVAGRPAALTVPMGSFSDWEWVRGALVWLGHEDPASTRAAITDNDPRKNDLIEVMDLWAAAFDRPEHIGDPWIAVAQIEEFAEKSEAQDTPLRKLRDRLVEVCCRGRWSGTSVGRWLTKHKDRVVGGRSFICKGGGGRGVMSWRLLTHETRTGQQRLAGTA